MRRFLAGVLVLASVVATVAPLTVSATANDFVINRFDAEYHLSRDGQGRSLLRTTERITATFSEDDQNHGIERAIPLTYDGHSTQVSIAAVKDAFGQTIPYSQHDSNGNKIVRIGDADTFVHGVQMYVIEYTQRDTTRFFSDTSADEFYWNVNGTRWSQTTEHVSAKVTVDDVLKATLTGGVACYQGSEGATEACRTTKDPDGSLLFHTTRTLKAGENMTLAIGFSGQTFTSYQKTDAEKFWEFIAALWMTLLVITSVIAIGVLIWIIVMWSRVMSAQKRHRAIVVEYLPPKDVNLLVSAQIYGAPHAMLAAALLDMAVRHYLKIYQTKDKKLLQAAEYELEITKDIADLSAEERSLIKVLFGEKDPTIGTRFAMKTLRNNYSLGQRLVKNSTTLRNRMRGEYGYYKKAAREAKQFTTIATILLVVGIVTLSPLPIIIAVVGYVCAFSLWPLTTKGAVLDRYLVGLKRYIEAAETERLRLLQSPDGVEKVGAVTAEKGALIKLYERTLPYAVLYGAEKEWLKQLGIYYDRSSGQPEWYSGTGDGAFNAVIFSAAISSFSDQSTFYGGSSGATSSGGSTGGGFSGGGGGGGGGGGW